MFQYIVCHRNQCIFFTIHHTVFADHRQTVYVRVNDKRYISFSTLHQVHDISQIFFQRFRIVGKVSGRFAIEFFDVFHPQTFQQFGQDDTSYRVHTVDSHCEISFFDSLNVYQIECQYTVDMFFIISQVFAIRSQMIDIRIIELLGSSNTKYFLPFGCIQEFSMLIQQFQCIPLFGVM